MTTAVWGPTSSAHETKRLPSQRLYFLCSGGMWDSTVEHWPERPRPQCGSTPSGRRRRFRRSGSTGSPFRGRCIRTGRCRASFPQRHGTTCPLRLSSTRKLVGDFRQGAEERPLLLGEERRCEPAAFLFLEGFGVEPLELLDYPSSSVHGY